MTTRKRYNVKEIAEILIIEIDEFKKIHKQGQKVNTEKLEGLIEILDNYKIDMTIAEKVRDDFNQIQEDIAQSNKQVLSDLKNFSKESKQEFKSILDENKKALKNGYLVPQWVYVLLLIAYFSFAGFISYGYYQNEQLRKRIKSYDKLYNEIPKEVIDKAMERAVNKVKERQ